MNARPALAGGLGAAAVTVLAVFAVGSVAPAPDRPCATVQLALAPSTDGTIPFASPDPVATHHLRRTALPTAATGVSESTNPSRGAGHTGPGGTGSCVPDDAAVGR